MGHQVSSFGTPPGLLTSNSVIAQNWRFDASAGTVHAIGSSIAKIVAVLNVTDGVWIYNPGNAGYTATTTSNRYVDLVFDTSSMSDDDELLVFCEEPPSFSEERVLLQHILNETRTQTALMLHAFEIDLDEIQVEDLKDGT